MHNKLDKVGLCTNIKIECAALGKHQAVISEEPQINDQSGDSKKGTNVLKNIQRSFSQHSNRGNSSHTYQLKMK